MRSSISSLLLLSLACPAIAGAQGVTVDHKKVDCIVAGKHPRLRSCFTPASQGSGSRVYFHAQDVVPWYYVEAKSDAPCHLVVLPPPSKKLVGKHVFYYVEAADRTSRTVEYDALVVRSAQECKDEVVAPSQDNAVVAVFPGPAPGFGGAFPTIAVVGGSAATVAAATIVVAAKNDDPPIAPAGPTPPPPTTPTLPPTTPPTTPGAPPLLLACTASPRSGQAPLRVAFQPFPSGGTGVYGFSWQFGDGGTSTQVSPSHVYFTPGSFIARVEVTSGSQVASCERSISVTPPPPPPPPTTPGPKTLTVTLSGTGTGTVTSSPPGINCLPDCTEPYTSGTVVTLTATPTGTSTFAGWSGGGCSGTGSCSVTMNAAQTVNAQFNAPVPSFVLTVNLIGSGTGTVTSSPPGINCLPDCTEPYTSGTVVTLTATPTGGSTFAGWSGGGCSGTGTCMVTMTAAQTVTAQFDPVCTTATLDVTKSGTGSGFVSGPGISCFGIDCTETYACGTPVTLNANPNAGSAFVTWTGGGCSGTGPCNLVMNSNTTVDAKFDLLPVTLTVHSLTTDFPGLVTSSPPGINCVSSSVPPGATCTASFPAFTPVQLTAIPNPPDTVFWDADCLGSTGLVCNLVMDAPKTGDATFFNPSLGVSLDPTSLRFSIELASRGAAGPLLVNGGSVAAVREGRMEVQGAAREENEVHAVLANAHEPGTMRFELPAGRIVPGSLRPLQGEVVLATPDTLVFRVQGKAGERLAFTFRLKRE